MSDASAIAEAIFRGCAANVGPLIGLELEPGPVSTEETEEPPEGELAVLPLGCEVDGEVLATLSLSSPLSEIVTLARRMLEDDEPDKERDLTSDDLDAIGEVLNLMSGATDQVIRDQVNTNLRARPLPWWRTPEPGENSFEVGPHILARGSLSVPGGSTVQLVLRLPAQFLAQGADVQVNLSAGRVALVGLAEELRTSLQGVLESARMKVSCVERDSEEFTETCQNAATILISADDDEGFELCRNLRCANETWRTTMILCMGEPTQNSVVRALESGASHVLLVPTDETTLLRVMNQAKPAV